MSSWFLTVSFVNSSSVFSRRRSSSAFLERRCDLLWIPFSQDCYSFKDYMGYQYKLLKPSGHVEVSSLLPLYFKSSFISFEVNMEDLPFEFKLSSFCFPKNSLSMSNFQCKYCVILFSNCFWIVLEQKGKCMIFLSLQTTIRQFFSPNLKLFLQRVVLLLNFNLNSVWIWINHLFLLQLLQQLTELVISGKFIIFFPMQVKIFTGLVIITAAAVIVIKSLFLLQQK